MNDAAFVICVDDYYTQADYYAGLSTVMDDTEDLFWSVDSQETTDCGI